MKSAILTLQPWSHVRIFIYRTWAIRKNIYYYSTLLMISRVQITQKTIRFLANVWTTHRKKKFLLSKPVWQVFISAQLVAALPKAHENWIQVSLSHILVINRQACKFILSSILYSLRYKITLLLDGLVCSIAGYFYFSPVFWPEKYSMTRKNMLRYLRTKPSNKFLFLIFILPAHMFFGLFREFRWVSPGCSGF